ncbi:MAG TPA: hypothetical protein VM261_17355 [Kofleriaceae bacterium]|nr:hypothetical protein [Kofleriaceae bacterium]
MRLAAAALALFAALAACDRALSAEHCGDHLGGVWETDDGSARWHIMDGGARLQAYPLVRELPAMPPGTQAAPSVLELRRVGREVAGDVVRRWHQGAHMCNVRAPARIRGCHKDRIALSIGDTRAPQFPGCEAPAGGLRTQLLRRSWP